ncbi:ATP-grasp domain-containing protein [Kitasatospora sp. NPDC101176]|uniref:ATP-grasp domain-containing protein n=1 Tax=Kitasatospora sp. NPDC101176 TaxID=3364099 RepID=UPI0037FB9447
MKRLLLIEGNGVAGEDLIDAAREHGAEVHVATHEDLYEKYRPELVAKIAGVVLTDFSAPDAAVAQLAGYCADNGVSGVICGWEFLSPVATRVAAEAGLPGNDPALADACRNKRLMSLAFEAGGVPAPRTLVVDSLDTVLDRIADLGLAFPLVVKPAENAGSVGVTVVAAADGLAEAYRLARSQPYEIPHRIALETTVVIQEYVEGREFSVETIVFEGRFHHLAVTEKFTTTGATRAETGHTTPADLDGTSRGALVGAAERALVALGFRNGVAHAELKLLPGGGAKVIEVGARPPGDHILKLVRHATGVSEARAYVQVALGEEPTVVGERSGAAAIRFLAPDRAGTVTRIGEVPDSPAVIGSTWFVAPGDEVESALDNATRLGFVMLAASSAAEVNAIADEVVGALRVDIA